MKNYIFSILVIITLINCDDSKVETNFLLLEDRLGTWINRTREDTLFFQSDTSLIRNREGTSGPALYTYRIDNQVLYLNLPGNSSGETAHVISRVEDGKVTLENMYIGNIDLIPASEFEKSSNSF